MAAARAYREPPVRPARLAASMLLWSALSLAPDADVIGFRFGVHYADTWGHRGATHSLAFSIALAFVIAALAALLRARFVRTFLTAALVLTSHAVLDMLTDGGLGCGFLWPFDDTRYFAPWNPIPVAPLGRHFFSRAGLSVALTELVMFAPLIAYALWPRRRGTLSAS